MSSSFQSIILKLQSFWASHGCLIAQPYYTQVGAGTMNPATFLRVLGPEPWNVAYVEPSVRPDDGRYGENPNRFQQHTQFQVILKPDPGDPVELYLQSLEAIGIDPRQHDIRLVEDNWQQPAISAWGLGWEVWLDGQEITQFTYFQQVGGVTLDPVSVELTYGLERILIALNNAKAIWDETWGANVTYGEIRRREEYEHSKYYFETADVARLRGMFDLFKAEAEACLARGLVTPAYDYVLKCSHNFNVLDTRGAIGVTERQEFFGQMRDLARRVAEAYLEQRKELEYPLLKNSRKSKVESQVVQPSTFDPSTSSGQALRPADFLLEIGVEELPAGDLDSALAQLRERLPVLLDELRLAHGDLRIHGTPRRLAVFVEGLAPRQADREEAVKGPPADKAIVGHVSNVTDSVGEASHAPVGHASPSGDFASVTYTPAAIGFAKKNGVDIESLEVREQDGGRYVFAIVKQAGRPAPEVLAEALPKLVESVKFDKSMRWLPASRRAGNDSGVAFSRPIRWLVCLFGETVIPIEYAGLTAGRLTRGLRPYGSPEIEIPSADRYFEIIKKNGVILDVEERKTLIAEGVRKLAASVKGEAIMPAELLAEVANLVEKPMPLLGSFDKEFLALPKDVLISVMEKHQRYFPVENKSKVESQKSGDSATFDPSGRASGRSLRPSTLLPYFIVIRNGDEQGLDLVRQGNEHVIGARFADADFFVREDLKHNLEDFRPRLGTLTFQKKLGSMLDKSERMSKLADELAHMLRLDEKQTFDLRRATFLAKADLVTRMVVEMTSLQGVMGREYALRSGENQAVAEAIGEQYQPVPKTKAGLVVALADRLDSLVGLFAAGLAPSGAKDPFGLRRAAIGVVQPLIEQDISFDLRAALEKAAGLQPIEVSAEVQAQVLEFMAGRLAVLLKDSGYKYDVVDAVLAAQAENPAGSARAVKQLQAWTERKDWREILPAYARCVRIMRAAGVDSDQLSVISDQLLIEAEEKRLYEAFNVQHPMFNGGNVDDFLNVVVKLIPSINAFFDKVLVMAEDEKVRQNRLALVGQIASLSNGIADMSKLEGF